MKIGKALHLITDTDFEIIVHDVHKDTFDYIRMNYLDPDRANFSRQFSKVEKLRGRKHDVWNIGVNSVTHRLEIRVNDYEGVADNA